MGILIKGGALRTFFSNSTPGTFSVIKLSQKYHHAENIPNIHLGG